MYVNIGIGKTAHENIDLLFYAHYPSVKTFLLFREPKQNYWKFLLFLKLIMLIKNNYFLQNKIYKL